MVHHRRSTLACGIVALSGALAAVAAGASAGSAAARRPVDDPASLVNPFIGTSGSIDMFPGPDLPFGMMQWSPDTAPGRPDGGGYEYNDHSLRGFSLTHMSGPGCAAYGDVPVLPTVGDVGTTPGSATAAFSHAGESAQAGYYSATLANGVTVRLTDTTRAGIGTFNFPATTQANLLLKLTGSESPVDGTSAQIIGNNEVSGAVTAGHFCGAPSRWERDYTLHFDIRFDQPFTANGTWGGSATSAVMPGSRRLIQRAARRAPTSPPAPASRQASTPAHAQTATSAPASTRVFAGSRPRFAVPQAASPTTHGVTPQTSPGVTNPGGVYLTFDTTTSQTVTAKVGISFTSDTAAGANLDAEIPGWNFDAVRQASHTAWNQMLGRIQISGGSQEQQVQFYTALYHALLHPNVISDDRGQYTGFDGQSLTASPGHAEYANYSGWDIYRSQVQLAAMVAPQQTSDSIRSMLDDYHQTGALPKWNLGGGESYVMVGDPADPVIADAYAFGARDFDTSAALRAMAAEAAQPNSVRPGLAELQRYGYLPYDHTYGCCNFYGPVSTQLEYDTADYAIAALARATGDGADYTKFATRAQNWQNIFDTTTGYMRARLTNGGWLGGFHPGTRAGFVEGTSAQYTPMVPFNLQALINARGGRQAWVSYLNGLLANITSPSADTANLSNEPSLEIPWEYDYAGAPYLTQQTVRKAQQNLYADAPVGQFGNDDLGQMSSWYVWSELGFYPQTPGTQTLALGSPVFPQAIVHLADGRAITINAPGAQPAAPYVHGLTVNGAAWHQAYVDFGALATGATLDFALSATPDTSWASGPDAVPPSDPTGERPAITTASPEGGLILTPGAPGTASFGVTNVTGHPLDVSWTASAPSGVTAVPAGGSLTVPAGSSATATVTVAAGPSDGSYPVAFTAKTAAGAVLPGATVTTDVAKPGELWPYDDNTGISADGHPVKSGFDSSGYLYSANALAAAGLTPGAAVTSGGVTYTWPDGPAGQPDNIVSAGQTIPVAFPAGTTTIGVR
ncbi:MAG TPA: lectin [Streptosporangiaceae bacterium]|nr:lectin [Streptosporangiaceae bacterium]